MRLRSAPDLGAGLSSPLQPRFSWQEGDGCHHSSVHGSRLNTRLPRA